MKTVFAKNDSNTLFVILQPHIRAREILDKIRHIFVLSKNHSHATECFICNLLFNKKFIYFKTGFERKAMCIRYFSNIRIVQKCGTQSEHGGWYFFIVVYYWHYKTSLLSHIMSIISMLVLAIAGVQQHNVAEIHLSVVKSWWNNVQNIRSFLFPSI